MSNTAIKVEDLGKLYRLGEISTGTISHDLNRWWAKVRGKEDPFAKVGEINDRSRKGKSDYVWALKDINFEVKQGEVLGIIGRNGAGKSTLLKILSKVTSPSSGRVKLNGRIASLLEVGTGFHPELTGRENVFLNGAILGMTKGEIRSKFDEIVDFAGVERYIDTPVKRYSSGMYVRLAFAVAAFLEPEILIIDEVLAVGDAEFQAKCLGRMQDVNKKDGRTVLFVSHNMDAVRTLCQRGLLMQHGRLCLNGPIEDVLAAYSKGDRLVGDVSFDPDPAKPSITRLYLDGPLLRTGVLKVQIDYRSPFPLKPPVAGVVVYNSMNQPVFGTNPRYHNADFKYVESSAGTLEVELNNIELHSGVYKMSFWLGDAYGDYDERLEAIVFNYDSQENYVSVPNPLLIGAIDKKAVWKVYGE